MCPLRADTGDAAEETGQAGIASRGSGESYMRTKLWREASSNEWRQLSGKQRGRP